MHMGKILKYMMTFVFMVVALDVHGASIEKIITFDPPALLGGSKVIYEYRERGLIFSCSNGMIHMDSRNDFSPDNNSAYLQFGYNDYPLIIEVEDEKEKIHLRKVELAHYSLYYRTSMVTFIGYRKNKRVTSQTFYLNNGIKFQDFHFSDKFTNLTRIEVYQTGYSIENLVFFKNTPFPYPIIINAIQNQQIRKRKRRIN